MLIDGAGRREARPGRPPRNGRPRLVVDEITGVAVVRSERPGPTAVGLSD